jgi:hypothetical protein
MTLQRSLSPVTTGGRTKKAGSAVNSRFVLQGVPRIGFYMGGERCPEDISFPACMRACLDYLGEGLGCRLISAHDTTWRLDLTYARMMAVTGCAFRLTWQPGWHADNVEIMYVSDDPLAPFARAFEAAGYEMIFMEPRGRRDDEQLYRDAILHNLRVKGHPVIAFGVIGPPEACLITGYVENGNTLTGWNFFQDFPEHNSGVEFEPTGEFRKRDWFAHMQCLLLFGKKRPAPPPSHIYRKALLWALEVMRTPATSGNPQNGGRYSGIAAYQAWADHLLREEDFPADIEVLRQRFMIHDDAVSTVAEGRWYAARFMEYLADQEPGMEEELLAAADCFEAEHDLMWQIWELAGGNGRSDEHVRKLAESSTRQAIVPLILEARRKDIEAAEHIERAVKQ